MVTNGRNGRGNLPQPEKFYNAAEIARFLSEHRRPTDRSTVRRWMLKGAGGVRMQSIRVGGQLLARWEWVDAFWAARNGDQIGDALSIPGVEQARARAAGEGLDRLMGRSNN